MRLYGTHVEYNSTVTLYAVGIECKIFMQVLMAEVVKC